MSMFNPDYLFAVVNQYVSTDDLESLETSFNANVLTDDHLFNSTPEYKGNVH